MLQLRKILRTGGTGDRLPATRPLLAQALILEVHPGMTNCGDGDLATEARSSSLHGSEEHALRHGLGGARVVVSVSWSAFVRYLRLSGFAFQFSLWFATPTGRATASA